MTAVSRDGLDLVLEGGRVIDPATSLVDVVAGVAIKDGRICDVGPHVSGAAALETVDCRGRLVCPGLIDLHAHVYVGGTSCGVDPDIVAERSGVTTLVDAGSAGPGTFGGFREHVIERATTRVLAYMNISFAGIFALSPSVMVGEAQDTGLLDARACLAAVLRHREAIVGVKVRVGRQSGGSLGLAPLKIAAEVAREAQLPLMVHIDDPPPVVDEVLAELREGDVLTHVMRPFPNALVVAGELRHSVRVARERGVLFDVGHGASSFDLESARRLLQCGVAPDTISSDVHCLSVEGLPDGLLTVMSKLLGLGMPLADVIAATTSRPAAAIGRPELGTLAPGAVGDVSVLEDVPTAGDGRAGAQGERVLRPVLRVMAGRLMRREAAAGEPAP
jgi:dihydroorotase